MDDCAPPGRLWLEAEACSGLCSQCAGGLAPLAMRSCALQPQRRHAAAAAACFQTSRVLRAEARTAGAAAPSHCAQPGQGERVTADDILSPARYMPGKPDGDQSLSRRESIEVRDGGYAWRPARALLDTGNEALTVIDTAFARRHSIYSGGGGGGVFDLAERWVTLRGVVPGASVQAPVLTVALRIRGHSLVMQAAVSELGPGTDVLVGVDAIEQLFAAGFALRK
eukprot:CAMPEP_0119353816 /NCGR_PEP_ID=MMETSP1334-20130426/2919_1 /TAXON_ID=127549 /ORGANISM="Calcidiscus leptoporus, Strain RCC1130" /LENGTH=224 /DNA_ID=CAMNT_0007367199 /DNA_START=63 /DNA_END=738 /DNA_ORIENTATION=+